MRAIEFKSKIKNNQIKIPAKLQSEIKSNDYKDVRVIVLTDDSERSDDYLIKHIAQEQFLQGYAESDSIYDN